MKGLIAGLCMLGLTATAVAQERIAIEKLMEPVERSERSEPVETERDAFTPQTRTVGKGRSIFEAAYTFLDHRRGVDGHSFPEMLYRFGISDRIELRLGWNDEVGGSGGSVTSAQGLDGLEGAGIIRESRILYGIKSMVSDQRGWLPESSFILQAQTPTSGKPNDTHVMLGSVFGWKLPNDWKIDTALRYSTASEAEDRFGIWAPSVVLRIPFGERWGVHAEYFGLFSQNHEANFVHHFASTGVHYLLSNNLEIGSRFGWGLNDQSSRFFANVGFGWRF